MICLYKLNKINTTDVEFNGESSEVYNIIITVSPGNL